MKKMILGLVLTLGIMASLSSCNTTTTYRMVIDENVSADQSATVTFDHAIKVKEHNNRNIFDDLYGGKENIKETILTVPAGNNRFLFDLTFSIDRPAGDLVYTYTIDKNNIEIMYDVEPEKKYLIAHYGMPTNFRWSGVWDLFVEIYDVTEKKTKLREWKVGEFQLR